MQHFIKLFLVFRASFRQTSWVVVAGNLTLPSLLARISSRTLDDIGGTPAGLDGAAVRGSDVDSPPTSRHTHGHTRHGSKSATIRVIDTCL